MKIVQRQRLVDLANQHPISASAVEHWIEIVKAATWDQFTDIQATFGRSVDSVKLPMRNMITIFDIKGNDFRLLTHVCFGKGTVFIKEFLTHAEYDKNEWTERLNYDL
ncbi:MAG: type II toxin-antitoxin system HigB family toxin [Planctomycetes bacterium]|nr:type II toxin-antitoxin system HigB family toxin [Planctomycetota bacterium]